MARPFRSCLPGRHASATMASFTLKGVPQSEAFMGMRCSVAVSMGAIPCCALNGRYVFSGPMGIPIVCATFVSISYNFCAVHYFLYHFIHSSSQPPITHIACLQLSVVLKSFSFKPALSFSKPRVYRIWPPRRGLYYKQCSCTACAIRPAFSLPCEPSPVLEPEIHQKVTSSAYLNSSASFDTHAHEQKTLIMIITMAHVWRHHDFPRHLKQKAPRLKLLTDLDSVPERSFVAERRALVGTASLWTWTVPFDNRPSRHR
jgi:hypothetical protein